jgi:predicted metal-binding membrane protein
MQSSALARAMPVCSGITLLLAAGLQFTAWKARRVACRENVCRYGGINADYASAAVLHGLRLALHDGYCCANFMAALFAVGVMNPFAMGAVTVAMAVEQWAPWRVRRLTPT